jgi:shikimate 5-dehydrogenase
MIEFSPATVPTMYFIGVSTRQSSIMRVFPLWADALGHADTVIRGIDCPLHADPEEYRAIVRFIQNDPLSLGALVTTHKIDLFNACEDLFDEIDPYAMQLREVSGIYKSGSKLCACAKDPISSGLALQAFVPHNFWSAHGGEVLLLGAGGSSLAMSLYLTSKGHGTDTPRVITITNRSVARLASAKAMLSSLNPNVEFRFIHCPTPADNDNLVSGLPPYSLVVNATGLGKDAPGSPITDHAIFPMDSLVWEINYRGDLLFQTQAKAQAVSRHLHVEDGWTYFIHGWTQVIGEVLHVPMGKETVVHLSKLAQAQQTSALTQNKTANPIDPLK